MDVLTKCKSKERAYFANHYANNKDRILARNNAYREKNKEDINKRRRQRYAQNNVMVRAKNNAYHAAHKDNRNKASKEYHARHKDAIREQRRGLINARQAVKSYYGCQNPACPCRGNVLSPFVLDFHHINKTEKKGNVRGSLKVMAKEINKCTVLCAVCHRLETHGLLDASTFQRCHVDDELNPFNPLAM